MDNNIHPRAGGGRTGRKEKKRENKGRGMMEWSEGERGWNAVGCSSKMHEDDPAKWVYKSRRDATCPVQAQQTNKTMMEKKKTDWMMQSANGDVKRVKQGEEKVKSEAEEESRGRVQEVTI
jgi:hypothetical protein